MPAAGHGGGGGGGCTTSFDAAALICVRKPELRVQCTTNGPDQGCPTRCGGGSRGSCGVVKGACLLFLGGAHLHFFARLDLNAASTEDGRQKSAELQQRMLDRNSRQHARPWGAHQCAPLHGPPLARRAHTHPPSAARPPMQQDLARCLALTAAVQREPHRGSGDDAQ